MSALKRLRGAALAWGMGCLLLVAALPAACAGAARASARDADPPPLGQLPDGVRPVHYVLALDVDPRSPRFSGDVQIEVELREPTQRFWLHGRGLNVRKAEVVLPDGAPLPARYSQRTPDGVVALEVDVPVPVGRATLHFVYDAPFDTQLAGLYRVAAAGGDYAFTQFEAIDARRAFPSFDEPRFKTPFALELHVPAGMTAAANSPSSGSQTLPDGSTRVRFQSTPPLPTYLVAFVVGDFDVVTWQPLPATALRDREVPLRGLAVKGKGPQLRRALAATEGIVTRMERYFDQPYPFAKLDIVAVPDFAAEAMENAGLITYREGALLLGDDATERQRRNMLLVHAHEIAHQWVGDLVTPPWWDDIWLNEAFATWMEHGVAAQVDPAGHYDRALLAAGTGAMNDDSLASVRRIREPVEDADDIANVFDGISYNKGAAVLTMLEGYLGEQAMREGIQRYFRRHAGGTATSADLIRAVAEGNGDASLVAAFDSFLEQPGVPLVAVRAQCAGGKATLTLRQRRYVPLGGAEDARARWTIPVCLRSDLGQQCLLLAQSEQSLALPTCPAWVMPNANATGYYRFALDARAFDDLLAHVDALNDRERIALADSVAAGFRAGTRSFADVLALAAKLAPSQEREVALALVELWDTVHWNWLTPAQRHASAARIRALYGPVYARLDLRQPEQRLFAASVLRFLALAGDDPQQRRLLAAGAMRYLGAEPAAGQAPLLPDFLGVALTVAVEERGDAAVDAILRVLQATSDGYQRALLVNALGAVRTPPLQERVRALLLMDTLRRNEVDGLLWSLFARGQAGMHWAWLDTHVDGVVAAASTGAAAYAPLLGAGFCAAADLRRVRATFAPRLARMEGAERSLAQAGDVVQGCIALRRKQGDGVLEALEAPDR